MRAYSVLDFPDTLDVWHGVHKQEAVLKKHGLDLTCLAVGFFRGVSLLTWSTVYRGQAQEHAIGPWGGGFVEVVYAWETKDRIRLITAWPVGRKEAALYARFVGPPTRSPTGR